jgi:PST family polysaccharide transporter
VITVEVVLMSLSFVLLSAVVFGSGRFRAEWRVYVLTFGMVIGQVLFPIWLFQGLERMKYVTVLNITAKLIFVGAIFGLVKKPSHYVYVPALNSLGFLMAGCISMFVAHRKFGIRFVPITMRDFVATVRSSFHIFLTTILSGQILLSTAAFFIGVFHTTTEVGYFSVAEKLLKALVTLRIPVTVSLYPFFSRKFQESVSRSLGNAFKVQGLLSVLYIPVLLVVVILARQIVGLISGGEYMASVVLLQIGVAYVLFNMYNSVVGVIIMINLGLKEQLMWIRLAKYGLFVILLLLVVGRWALLGPIILIVAIEVAETFLYVAVGVKRRIWRVYKDAKTGSETAGWSVQYNGQLGFEEMHREDGSVD